MACLSVIVVRLVLNDVNVVKRRLGNSLQLLIMMIIILKLSTLHL